MESLIEIRVFIIILFCNVVKGMGSFQQLKGVGTLRAKIGPISEMKQTLKNENTRFTECKSV